MKYKARGPYYRAQTGGTIRGLVQGRKRKVKWKTWEAWLREKAGPRKAK